MCPPVRQHLSVELEEQVQEDGARRRSVQRENHKRPASVRASVDGKNRYR